MHGRKKILSKYKKDNNNFIILFSNIFLYSYTPFLAKLSNCIIFIMKVSGKLRQCPPLDARVHVCRRCFNTNCTCSKVILSCRCRVSATHEECLIKEIKSKPQLVSPSQAHPGYNEYRCSNCNFSLLYRPDFSNSCIPCSSYTANETCLWIYFSILYLVFFWWNRVPYIPSS